jgi:hypothetical protein
MMTIEPAMVGQMLGLALLGLAWLSLRGAVDGAMTIGVAKIVGHVTWLAGALVLAWALGPHTLWLPALGIVPNLLIGGLLIVVGLGGARFASAVRKREIAKAAQSANAKGRSASAPPSAPVEPVLRSAEPSVAPRSVGSPHVMPAEPAPPPVRTAAAAPAPVSPATGQEGVRPASPAAAPRPPFHG